MFLCLFLAACSLDASAPSAAPSRDRSLGGHILFEISGGFAGLRQSLSIDDRGLALARDERRRLEVPRQLSVAQLAEIKSAFAKVDDGKQSPRELSHPCADCLQHTLTATIGGERHNVRTQVPSQATPYGEVMALLSQILRDALSSGEVRKK